MHVLDNMKAIVIFYSYEGNTKLIAQTIADELGADIEEIKPVKEIQSKGFMKFMWGGRQAVMGSKPELKPLEKNLDKYDLLIIGTPIWAWSPTPPIKTLLEDHIPKRKMAFFCSHEGGPGKTFEKMRKMAGKGEVISEMDFFAPLKQDKEATLNKVKKWAKKLS